MHRRCLDRAFIIDGNTLLFQFNLPTVVILRKRLAGKSDDIAVINDGVQTRILPAINTEL